MGSAMVLGLAVPLGLFLASASRVAAEPRAEALNAWRAYEARADARYSSAGAEPVPLFAQDALGAPGSWRGAALGGQITATGVEAPAVPDATIHHWAGAVFIPNTTLDQVIGRLQEQAGSEARLYEDVVESRLLARDGPRLRVFMKLRRRTVLTVTYNTEHAVEYRRVDRRRGASRSIATRIAELADAGTPAEREKPPGLDHCFLWRLNAYWRYEETAGGVLVECETISLSRSVPALARPLVTPIVNRVARESLVKTLAALRAALSGPALAPAHE
jgi:hypothetical protein